MRTSRTTSPRRPTAVTTPLATPPAASDRAKPIETPLAPTGRETKRAQSKKGRTKALVRELDRISGGGTLSFGGRLASTETHDAARLLRKAYPSLSLAQALVKAMPARFEAVESFVADLEPPERLQGHVRRAAGLLGPNAVQIAKSGSIRPQAQPLGTTFVSRHDICHDRVDATALLTASDETVINWCRSPNGLSDKTVENQSLDDTVALLHVAARAVEIGGAQELGLEDYPEFVKRLPSRPDIVAVVRRLERALAKDGSRTPQPVAFRDGRLLDQLQVDDAEDNECVYRIGHLWKVGEERDDHKEIGGWSMMASRLKDDFDQRFPSLGELSDDTIVDLPSLGPIDASAFQPDGSMFPVAMLYAVARAHEIGVAVELTPDALETIQTQMPDTPETVAALRRFCRASGIDPRQIYLDGRTPLAPHVRGGSGNGVNSRVNEDDLIEPSATQLLKQLKALGVSNPQKQLAALNELIGPKSGASFTDLFELGLSRLEAGEQKLANIDQKSLQDILQNWEHPAAILVLGLLFCDDPMPAIESILTERDPAVASAWVELGHTLGQTEAKSLEFVVRPLIESAAATPRQLQLRIALANSPTLSRSGLKDALAAANGDETEFAQALEEAIADRQDAQPEAETVLDLLLGAGKVDVERLPTDSNLLGRWQRQQVGRVEADLATPSMGRSPRVQSLVELLATLPEVEADEKTQEILHRAYANDIGRLLPMSQMVELNSTPQTSAVGEDYVRVAGIDLPLSTHTSSSANVPTQQAADLVMTETTQHNLSVVARAWFVKAPVLLEGPTAAGKTSMVRYAAYKTKTPYRRINLSYQTEVSDLLGRFEGGRYTEEALENMPHAELKVLAEQLGLEGDELSKPELTQFILQEDPEARWVDGPVIQAMKNGEVLLLDEINLARGEVLERLNSLFDDDGNIVLTEHDNEVITPHEAFRVFATMNPGTDVGRSRLSKAMRSRWSTVWTEALTPADLTTVMAERYGDSIPLEVLTDLIATHEELSRAAELGDLGRSNGRMAFTLRNLFRVAERFKRFSGGLEDRQLLRREVEEVYVDGLWDPAERQHAQDLLNAVIPADRTYYDDLEVIVTDKAFQIGDVTISRRDNAGPLAPGPEAELVPTDRTKRTLYKIAKAASMGENISLLGERASGKTAIAKMYAMLRGLPYQRQGFCRETDISSLIGSYDHRGFVERPLLQSFRSDGEGGVFVADEWNLANAAIKERLNSVLDDERQIAVVEKAGGEIVEAHEDFVFVATGNPPTQGYGGRQKLSPAEMNRFTTIYVEGIETAEELHQIAQTRAEKLGLSEAAVRTLVDLHVWVAKAYESGELGAEVSELDRPEVSIRQLNRALDEMAAFNTLPPARRPDLGQCFMYGVTTQYLSPARPEDRALIEQMAQELAQ